MTSGKRIGNFLIGLLMILVGGMVLIDPNEGYGVAVAVLQLLLLFYGIKHLVYYFSLARFMVGGITVFYKGIVLLDLALFAFLMDDLPRRVVMLYLVGMMGFAGLVDILKSFESKRIEAPSWKYTFSYGLLKILIAFTGLFFINSFRMLSYIYCIGMFHGAISRIVTACRKTAIVYIDSK